MDIDGYDGSQLAEINNTISNNISEIDNSLSGNMNAMFDITRMSGDDQKIDPILTQPFIHPDNSDDQQNENIIENVENQTPSVTTTSNASSNENKDIKMSKGQILGFSFIFIFAIVWILLGIAAFIASLVCFGFSGTTAEKAIGLLISLFLGPFYWLYFYFNKNYCGKSS